MRERIGLGCASFVSKGRGVAEAEARRILNSAYDAGVRFFDTAYMYGAGRSEELVGEELASRRDTFTLLTKGGVELSDPTNVATMRPSTSKAALRRQIETSLERLRTDHVDIFLLHQPDPDRPVEEQMEALAELRERGLATEVGISNYTASDCAAAFATGVPSWVEYSYSLIDHRNLAAIDVARSGGGRVVGFGTFAHGLLSEDLTPDTEFGEADWRRRSRTTGDARTSGNPMFAGDAFGRNLDIARQLRERAEALGVSLATYTLALTLHSGVPDVVLIGCRSTGELAANLEALAVEVTAEERAAVASIVANAELVAEAGSR